MKIPPLNFTANTAGSTVQLTKTGTPTEVSLETSTDGNTWSDYTIGDTITLTNIGDKIYFRNKSETDTGFALNAADYYQFVMTGSVKGNGDLTTLLNKNGTDTLSDYCFYILFMGCTSLTDCPLLLATNLGSQCYRFLFRGCTSLTDCPSLPANILATGCYFGMFMGCTSLSSVSEMVATTLASQCCYYMFQGCTSLETLPKLSATALPTFCYAEMFSGCSKIKLSSTQTGEYQTAYRIPTSGTGTNDGSALNSMFYSTGGTFTGTPSINTTYYTSNTVI